MPHLPPTHHETSKHDSPNETKVKKIKQNYFEFECKPRQVSDSSQSNEGIDHLVSRLVWCYEKSGTYSSHSCYSIISYRGVKHVYIPAIWSIVVPPKIHLFLWLVAYNKLATVDNLTKKGLMKNPQCCFCNENESVSHLFFECVVAKVL
jgi:hypothetical protein